MPFEPFLEFLPTFIIILVILAIFLRHVGIICIVPLLFLRSNGRSPLSHLVRRAMTNLTNYLDIRQAFTAEAIVIKVMHFETFTLSASLALIVRVGDRVLPKLGPPL